MLAFPEDTDIDHNSYRSSWLFLLQAAVSGIVGCGQAAIVVCKPAKQGIPASI
jgi:hypothetical protein